MDRLFRMGALGALFAIAFSAPALSAPSSIPVPSPRPNVTDTAPVALAETVPVPKPRPDTDDDALQFALAVPAPLPNPRAADASDDAPDQADTDTDAGEIADDGEDPGDTAVADADPTIVRPVQRISCVPYARERSGIAIYGDARTWWDKATGLFDKFSTPVEGAVMVFTGTKKLKRGHVAVVTKIVSAREVRVDHANWMRDGNIYLDMPVMDVSRNNDWSQVRVWNAQLNQWGVRVYPISGFIAAKRLS